MFKKIFIFLNLLLLILFFSNLLSTPANAQQSCGTLSATEDPPSTRFNVVNGAPGERIYVLTFRSNGEFSGQSPIELSQDGTGTTAIPLGGNQYRAFLSLRPHSTQESDVPCSNSVTFSVQEVERKVCGEDTYEGRPTYCSTSALNRVRVPYGGCREGEIFQTEFCVADAVSEGDITCPTATGQGINTAVGCIPFESPNALIAFILRWAIGIGGGIAFLLMLYAGFIIMTSTGNPERLKGGQELLTSAIAGLIMLIFSIFILRLIGINILQIPGFGT